MGTGLGFSDNFSYTYNVTRDRRGDYTGSSWINLPDIAHTALNVGATAEDTGTYTPRDTGSLLIRHCVDSTNAIIESSESSNCTVSGLISVGTGGSPDAELDASPCSIVAGSSSCNSTVSWSALNFTNTPEVRNGLVPFSNDSSNPGVDISLPYGVNTISIYDGSTFVKDIEVNAACVDGTDAWDGATCVAAPVAPMAGINISLTASPRVVNAGGSTNISWALDGNTSCSLTGGSLGPTYNNVLSADGTISVAVNARTTYTLTCGALSDTFTVEIVPVGTET